MLNQCQFIGNLGADPEVRTLQNGNKVCSLRLAVSETWKDKNTGEKKESTEWVSVSIFTEALVRIAENYLKKGSKVFIQGKLKTRKWQDQSGADRYSTEVVLQGFDGKIKLLGGKPSQDDGGYTGDYGSSLGGNHDTGLPENKPSRAIDDEIPF